MRLIFIVMIFVSFALVSADDNPYGVSTPTVLDTSAKTVKAPAVVKDSTTAKKTTIVSPAPVSKKDSVMAQNKTSVKDSAVAQKVSATPDTTAKVKVKKDSTQVVNTSAPKTVDTTVKADTATPTPKPRQRIVRETTINSLDEMKGKYRSPKQALFMSLVVPGLGQAYVGQTKFNYVRAATYFATDIVLGAFWYDYVVVKHDRVVSNYHKFADAHWSQIKYEDSISQHSSDANFLNVNPSRETYCNAVELAGTPPNGGCLTPGSSSYQGDFIPDVQAHEYNNLPADQALDSTSKYRAGYPSPFDFYSLIGQEQEFISGWTDASGVVYGDSVIQGTSDYRDQYIAMRAQANRYARMQSWFLGGMVLNHIASALDAALTASFHNRELYQTETMWYDRLHFDGGLAFDQGWPKTNIKAFITF